MADEPRQNDVTCGAGRRANGDFQWRENTITIKGDEYSDTGSDSCSNHMTRL
jgi:hypothetical protein